MNFFKSILSDDPDPVNKNNFEKSDESADEILNPTSSGEAHSGGLWSFGDLVKNLTTNSESVIESDDEGDEEQITNSNSNYSVENDVIDDDSNSGGGGLWRFGDLVKTITNNSESLLETYSPNHQNEGGDEEQLTNADVSNDDGGGLWRFGDLVKTITSKSELVPETYSPNHENEGDEQFTNSDVSNDDGGGLWRFGDLVKNLTSKSESVLETYRRDLKEFGSGLKKESDLFREVANRAVKELPETMKKSISQGKPSSSSDSVNDSDVNKVHFSRFDSQLNAMQNDVETYCKDPEDSLDEYNKWKLGFVLSENEGEIGKLIQENGIVEEIYRKVVPNEVDEGSFWCRYFYKVYKLKQQERIRASFVRRSLNVDDDEEELSWDVDDDDEQEDEEAEIEEKTDLKLSRGDGSDEKVGLLPKIDENDDLSEKARKVSSNENVESVSKTDENDDLGEKARKVLSIENVESVLKTDENHDISENSAKDLSSDKVELVTKTGENHDLSENDSKEVCDEKIESVLKTDKNHDISETAAKDMSHDRVESGLKTEENLDICKSVKSSLHEEEDLEWDEIGDIGENDEKNVSQSEITPKKSEVLKQLSTAVEDDDEDLSWDIEDDDEPVKAATSK